MAARRNAADRLLFTRIYDAPRELVFAVWTDPQHIENWWGPKGFTTSTRVMEVRVGGVWDYVMRGPDGAEYPGRGVFTEIDKPKLLAFTHVGGKADDPHLSCEFLVTFEELDGKTKLTLRMTFPSTEAAEHARELGAEEGGVESLERLAHFLRTTAA